MIKWCLVLICAFWVTACQDPGDTRSGMEFDETPPHITQWMQQPAILVYSRTDGWRHNEGIAGADKFFVELAREKGYGIFTTVNGAVFNTKDLSRFDVVVFNNMTGNTLSSKQQAAFQEWLKEGGAWIGLHGAGDNTHIEWSWYARSIIGTRFIGHPQTPHMNTVRVETLDVEHPIMQGVPQVWQHTDEWYFFDRNPADFGLRPLAGIYESDFAPEGDDVAKLEAWAMGPEPSDHPVMWVSCHEEGRAFYSALGHSDLPYDVAENRLILKNAFEWVTRVTDPAGAGCNEPK